MAGRTPPFAPFEWLIAWRYLRARRREGGVSVMSIISLIGVALAVFALIATLAVRSGFRTEFVNTIVGANAHVSLYDVPRYDQYGALPRGIENYDAIAEMAAQVPGVVRAAPLVSGQVMATANGRNTGVEIYGERLEDLRTIPLVNDPETEQGDLSRFDEGVALGLGVAQALGLSVGDTIRLISPDGVKGPFGTTPRIGDYEVVYIFQVGRYDIDRTRIYMPLAEAQSFFNREGRVDAIEIMVDDAEEVDRVVEPLLVATGGGLYTVTWREQWQGFLRALEMEDNIMFIILSILVLIASMNIVSGLIMLVKNKGRDVGILRTMGLSEGSVLRVFFICGASIGLAGTAIGVVLGCLFAIYIDPIFNAVNWIMGGGVWDPSVRYISQLPAELRLEDVLKAVALSLGLSFGVTWFPARRAARLNPVEALRYE
ncbi:lipoprotein-releasing ABC transporter permease subunit [Halovulum dunhuangense]|uniref:Lipoprotein-releasing ABC transporter permease subunit n=1 Tax=Halovulum dunhuangense TaxID=1505036 RepID=A0A849L4Y5_9RHOB|nr:lipoprotein-releasing ABC transporter permease subunit [Halovulum dunhuangense]NNU81197.1 lipoprotein-releasing ABC transporter permease subunit [Halovulum dunhuangense]